VISRGTYEESLMMHLLFYDPCCLSCNDVNHDDVVLRLDFCITAAVTQHMPVNKDRDKNNLSKGNLLFHRNTV
jgi:hypothetical protein